MKNKKLIFDYKIILIISIICITCSPTNNNLKVYNDDENLYQTNIKKDLNTLSSPSYQGRSSGTPYSYKTARYLENFYKNNFFVPLNQKSYVNNFKFDLGYNSFPEENYIEWEELNLDLYNKKNNTDQNINQTNKINNPILHKSLVKTLPISMGQMVKSKLIFGGYCIKADKIWDDLTSIKNKIKNNIVLCLRFGPNGKEDSKLRPYMPFIVKYNNLKNLGAAGIIFLGGVKNHPAPNMEDFPASLQKSPPAVYLEPEFFYKSINKKFYFDIIDYSKQNKNFPSNERGKELGIVELKTNFKITKKHGRNIGAFLWTPLEGQKVVVVGAHFDHIGKGNFSSMGKPGFIHYGADDNASGTVAVMEIARNIKKKYASNITFSNLTKYNNILFIHFDAEERGLFGSQAFVNTKIFSKLNIHLMINLDMVGRLRNDVGISIQGKQTAAYPFSNIIENSFKETNFPKELKTNWVGGGEGPSDHTSFHQKKIPVIFITTGSHPEYHTQNDKSDLINYEGIEFITQFVTIIIDKMFSNDKPMTFEK